MVKLQKVVFAVKTRRNLCLVRCVCTTRYLPMFCKNRQIPRYAYLGFSVVVAFCYDVLLEPCDGFSDFLPVLLVFYATLGVLL